MSAVATYNELDILKTWCLSSTLNYTKYFFNLKSKRNFVVNDHHRIICGVLDDVLSGKHTKVMINVSPRYSKTEIVVKNFISMGLGMNPQSKWIHLSYSDDLVRDNSRDIQNLMLMPEYQKLFDTKPTSSNTRKWYTPEGGGLYAVSTGGQVTGFGAGLVDEEFDESSLDFMTMALNEKFGGAIIIDDPIKPEDALSPVIRSKINARFDSTLRNRVNSRKTPIIIIGQRTHEQDLCGFLLEQEPGEWHVVSLPVIYQDADGADKALWPFKHTLEELRHLRELDPYIFDTQYMQNPKPLTGLMYERGFKVYDLIPNGAKIKKAYIDTADEGEDFLCAICYDEMSDGNYVTDVLYTQKPMEYTETATANMITENKTTVAVIESNNGGRSFARAVESQCRSMENGFTRFVWFHQSQNKFVRIFTNSAAVQNMVFMPRDWEHRWPAFARSLKSYMKVGNNAHDDAEDCATATIEQRKKAGMSIRDLSNILP